MLTLAKVYGQGVVYHPRAPGDFHLLRQGDESIRDVASCTLVTISDGMPTICAAASLSPEARELVQAAGLPWLERPIPYRTQSELSSIVRDCVARGQKIAFQNAQAPDAELDKSYWFPRELLTLLNDKAEMARFAPVECCPPRRVMLLDEAVALPFISGSTVVVKGSTTMSTGSGGAVVIARTEAQLRSVGETLRACTRVVVEEYLPFVRTFCLNFAADPSRKIHYLGSAEQVVNAAGVYLGSWIGPEFSVPDAAIALGREVMRRAVDLGYTGYAGCDFGILPDGGVVVFDLNFRMCASTPALLWFPELQRRFGTDCHLRTLGLEGAGSFTDFYRAVRPLVEEGTWFPLGAFDPSKSEWPDRPPAARGIVTGRNRAETEARCENLIAMGFARRPPSTGTPRRESGRGPV